MLSRLASKTTHKQATCGEQTSRRAVEAFLQGQHSRLGAKSLVSTLPPFVVKDICQLVMARRQVFFDITIGIN